MCAQCVLINPTDVVTLKDKLIKKLLLPVILMQHWIASFDPKELHNDDANFFLFLATGISRLKQSTNTCTHSSCTRCSL